jgi:hypothetical protein
MPKIDLSARYDRAKKTLADSQDLRNRAGIAQKEADRLAKAIPGADKAGVSVSSAASTYDNIAKSQDALITAGIDPSEFFGPFLADADRCVQSAQDYIGDAKTAAGL